MEKDLESIKNGFIFATVFEKGRQQYYRDNKKQSVFRRKQTYFLNVLKIKFLQKTTTLNQSVQQILTPISYLIFFTFLIIVKFSFCRMVKDV